MNKKNILKIILVLFSLNIIVSFFVFSGQYFTQESELQIQNLTTFQQWVILIAGLLCFVLIGNFLIHKYYQKQHRKILNKIKTEEYEFFKDLKLTQTWILGFRINRADLILLKNEIIVLIYNSNFKGIIKHAQHAILFYQKNSEQLMDGISDKIKIEKIFSTTNGIKIINVNLKFVFSNIPIFKKGILSSSFSSLSSFPKAMLNPINEMKSVRIDQPLKFC